MATIQVRVEDSVKSEADSFFNSFGIDTSTAVRMFISSVLDNRSIPFDVRKTAGSKGWSEEYIKKVMEFGKTPDPTFCEQTEEPFTDRGELFK